METKPYESPEQREMLPMSWSDGRTVPVAFTAPPNKPRSRVPVIAASVVGGLAVGGIGLVVALYVARSPGADAEPPATAVAAEPTPPATKAAEVPVADAEATPPASPCPDGMVLVEGGDFFMGTDAKTPVLSLARPAHPVKVSAYCIDIDEVTVDEYRNCSVTGKCKRAYRDSTWPQGGSDDKEWRAAMDVHSELCNEQYEDRGDHPINCVDWNQARAFCRRRGGDLPTEAQWEFAARGSDGRVYSWGDAEPTPAHMNGAGPEYVQWRKSKGLPEHGVLYDAEDGFVGTAPVGSFAEGATQYGLRDIAGNVFEWTLDEFRGYDNGEADSGGGPTKRVIRGGAFNSFEPQFADPALRFPQDEDAHNHGIGFRCAAEPGPSSP
jgi:formylglycine-generating enzyme required for sulfatase activity